MQQIGAIERYGALTKHKKSFTTKIKQKLGLLSEKDKAKLESKDEDKQRIAQMERDPEEEGKKTTQGTFKVWVNCGVSRYGIVLSSPTGPKHRKKSNCRSKAKT